MSSTKPQSTYFSVVVQPAKNDFEPQYESIDPFLTFGGQENPLLSCTVCFKVFPTLIKLQRHYIKHVVNKPFPCSECGKSFFTEFGLENHTRLHTERPFPCEICQNCFLTESALETHMQKHMFPDLVCNLCFEHFLKEEDLRKHERKHTTALEGTMESGCLPCVLCDFQFIYKHDLEDHMNSHEKVRDYTCEECNEVFFYSYILQLHEGKHDNKEICNVCSETFANKMLLSSHERIHLRLQLDGKRALCFACDLCDATFPFKIDLEDHYNAHDSAYRYPCTFCDQTFFFSFTCRKHKASHTEISKHKCNLCPKIFRQKGQLNRHVNDKHCPEKFIICPVCGKSFASKRNMQQHCVIHAAPKPFLCEFCELRFASRSNLERHYFVHMTEKPFKCTKCEMSFRIHTKLKEHLQQHEEGWIYNECYVCEKKFTSKQMMRRHIREDHPEEKRSYMCDICGKVLQTYTSFYTHYRLHTGGQPYKCAICDKVYNQKGHLLMHHNYKHPEYDFNFDLPFKCAYCHQGYLKQSGLVMHHKKHHPELELYTTSS